MQLEIEERERTLELLQESEQKFRTLTDYAPMAISILRMDRFVFVNSTWESMFEYTEEEAMTLKPGDTVHPDVRKEIMARARARLRGENVSAHYEMKGITKRGKTKWFYFSAVRIIYEGQPATLAVALDITAQLQAAEEREKLIQNLQHALDEIETLRGILPICSFCKRIREDEGYWEQVDVYIHKHSKADFSHGICPDCLKKHYPATCDKRKNT